MERNNVFETVVKLMFLIRTGKVKTSMTNAEIYDIVINNHISNNGRL